MDLTQLLEELILIFITLELVELAYHINRMRKYEKKIDQHLTKMDEHVMKMNQHVDELRNRMAQLNKLQERRLQEETE